MGHISIVFLSLYYMDNLVLYLGMLLQEPVFTCMSDYVYGHKYENILRINDYEYLD